MPESSPYRVASADVGRAAGLAPEIAATAVATLVDRLGEAIQRGQKADLRFPHVGMIQSRGARVEFVFGSSMARRVDPGGSTIGSAQSRKRSGSGTGTGTGVRGAAAEAAAVR